MNRTRRWVLAAGAVLLAIVLAVGIGIGLRGYGGSASASAPLFSQQMFPTNVAYVGRVVSTESNGSIATIIFISGKKLQTKIGNVYQPGVHLHTGQKVSFTFKNINPGHGIVIQEFNVLHS